MRNTELLITTLTTNVVLLHFVALAICSILWVPKLKDKDEERHKSDKIVEWRYVRNSANDRDDEKTVAGI